MATSHAKAQDLAESVYLTGRRTVLKGLAETLRQLDKVYAADAAAIQAALKELLEKAGVPQSKVKKVIDDVFKSSRPQRVELVAEAIRQATVTAAGTDSKTFKAIFEGDRDAAVPLGRGRSSSPKKPTPWLRLVRASEGSSRATN